MKTYIDSLINKLYKILALKEAEDAGQTVFLKKYLADLSDELASALDLFPILQQDIPFLEIRLGVNWLLCYAFDHEKCKSKVFKCISNVKKMLIEVVDSGS